MQQLNLSRPLLLVILGTAGLLVAGAIVLNSANDTTASPDRTPEEVRANYELLDSGEISTDAAAGRLAEMAGASSEHVRKVEPPSGVVVNVAVGSQKVCMVVRHTREAVLGCGSVADMAAGRNPMVSVTPTSEGKQPTWRVTALLPNDVKRATVRTADDEQVSEKVESNIATFTMAGAPRGMTWTSANAEQAIDFNSLAD